MSFVDGYVMAVPAAKKAAYQDVADKAAVLFKQYGAVRVVENWGVDVPDGKLTSFGMAVKAEPGEVVVFSWIEWPDKATRDEGMAKAVEDPAFGEMGDMPFDGKRMIFGGFETMVDA